MHLARRAAALYPFAPARQRSVVCRASFTNEMAQHEHDVEKGRANGAHDALQVIEPLARAFEVR